MYENLIFATSCVAIDGRINIHRSIALTFRNCCQKLVVTNPFHPGGNLSPRKKIITNPRIINAHTLDSQNFKSCRCFLQQCRKKYARGSAAQCLSAAARPGWKFDSPNRQFKFDSPPPAQLDSQVSSCLWHTVCVIFHGDVLYPILLLFYHNLGKFRGILQICHISFACIVIGSVTSL